MTISREAVEWGYRLFLDREPDLECIDGHMKSANTAHLRGTFLNSEEYRGTKAEPKIGDHNDIREVPVETDATPEEARAMLDRIAREWRRYGEEDPHWSVIVNPDFHAGSIEQNIDYFYETGFHNLPIILNALNRSAIDDAHLGKVLDFGCGVGRLSLALASRAEQVVGLDISEGHLRKARERAASTGAGNVRFLRLDEAEDLDNLAGFDLVVSLIVLQHNPPPIMAILFRKLLLTLAIGGVAVIQIPTLIRNYRFTVADYLSSEALRMEMNALPQKEVFRIIDETQCRVLEVHQDGWIGVVPGVSMTFVIQRISG